jgi:NAD+ kinase
MSRIALIASITPQSQDAASQLNEIYDFVALDEAEIVIALGGDGHMLQVLHRLLEERRDIPVFGMNLGTIGFLMNSWRPDGLILPAINEISLLRETRQAAKIEINVNGRPVIPELICDGILAATPAGSTAYNLSANGPILPLDSSLLALTPISPFRPRRWKGAILPDRYNIELNILEAVKRPVSAVADQREIREVASVGIALDRNRTLTLLFDPEHALDDRIAMEQFVT